MARTVLFLEMTYIPGFENPIGHIEGVRQWIIRDGLLLSICSYFLWEPWKAAESEIEKYYSDEIPSPYVPTGIHAAKPEHDELLAYNGDVITGRVALWGKVFIHEKGYRAQYAYPLSFDHCADRHVNLDELREIYLQPPTEKAQIIVRERLKWISERKKDSLKLGQLAYRPPSQAARMAVARSQSLHQYMMNQNATKKQRDHLYGTFVQVDAPRPAGNAYKYWLSYFGDK